MIRHRARCSASQQGVGHWRGLPVSGRKGSCVRLLVIVLSCAVALAGCGGDPKADPSPAPSSPTTSASPTPTPPVMPGAAKANTKAGAVAFVKYYIELINHAQATGDTEALARVESDSCHSCKRARNSLDEIYASGGHLEGGEWTADIRSVTRRPDVDGWTALVLAQYAPQKIVKSGGTTPLKGGKSLITFVVRRDAVSWNVLQWTRAS